MPNYPSSPSGPNSGGSTTSTGGYMYPSSPSGPNGGGSTVAPTSPLGQQFAAAQATKASQPGGGGAAQATAAGQADKPQPLSRWYATVESVTGGRAVVSLDDDSAGGSVITVPVESITPAGGDRVIVDFRDDGLVVVSAIVA